MNEQVFTIVATVIGILLAIIGFFCSFLLYLIFAKQSSTEEKLVTALSKIEGLEQARHNHESILKMLLDRVNEKCDRHDCPYLNDRGR
jgi:uncharacterized membrane protein